MNKTFNINILNQDSCSKIISRAEAKKNIRLTDNFTKESIIINAGSKGWVEWNGKSLIFELDHPIACKKSAGSSYRVIYNNQKRKFKKEIRCYEASNQERIEYIIKDINIQRDMKALSPLNPNTVRLNLNMALINNTDLQMAIQTYLDDIKVQK